MDLGALSPGRNTSICYEIPVDEVKVRTPRTPRTPNLLKSPNRSVLCEIDLAERLSKADERRSTALKETSTKNEEYVRRAMSKCEQEREKTMNRSLELLENLQEDIEKKAQRRQQVLEERVNAAKKQLEKVEQVTVARSSSKEVLMRQIDEDMSNKENKRRSIIQSIKQHCQHE
ncbi:hypothetical protein X801_07742, partial [Opisthorchis viverrini]